MPSVLLLGTVIGSMLLVGDAQAALGRVFTTEQDRALIERERLGKAQTPVEKKRDMSSRISCDAILVGAKNALWINRKLVSQPIEINGVTIDPKHVSIKGVWLETIKGKRLLKQGQVYLIEKDKVIERYEVG